MGLRTKRAEKGDKGKGSKAPCGLTSVGVGVSGGTGKAEKRWSQREGKGDKLFSRLLEAKTLAEVRILLSTRTSVYWENHYIFGRTSPQREKLLGEQSKDLIIINTVVPFLYTYGLHKADEGMCERAGRFLEELKAENNHIIRSWSDAGLPVASAADSQALIQLQKEYCDKRKCLYCRFGYEYLRKK